MRNLLGNLILRCSTSCIHAVVRGRDNGPTILIYRCIVATMRLKIMLFFDFVTTIARHCRLLLLATIALSPADF